MPSPASMRATESLHQESILPCQPQHAQLKNDRAAAPISTSLWRPRFLTDAAARAGAAIMRLYHEGAKVSLKDDASPVTEADKASEAIVIDAPQRLAPDIPIVSEEIAGDRSADLGPASSGRSARRHQGVHPEALRLHRQYRPGRGRPAPLRPRLCAGAVNARHDAGPGTAIEVTVEPSERGADLAALDCRTLHVRYEGLVAVVSRSTSRSGDGGLPRQLKIAGRSDAGSALKFLEVARGVADVYPRFGPTMEWDTAAGHAILAAAGGMSRTPRESRSATARPRRACAIRALSPGAKDRSA